MNEAAIRKTAEIIDRMNRQLRHNLANNQLFEYTHIAKQIERREHGAVFTVADHIRGMVYAMLSSGISWKQVEGGVDEKTGRIIALDEILYNYDTEKLLSADPSELRDKIKAYKWASQSTLKQMNGLIHTNIQKLIGFEEKCGSIDAYYQRFIEEDPTYQSLITNLSKADSQDKFAEMGAALTAEYLRNVGYDMSKPDRHIRRILGSNYLCCSDSEVVPVFDAMEIVNQIALLCGRRVAEVDYILWSYCANGYGEICTIQKPKCGVCTASEFCERAQQDKKYARLLDDEGQVLFSIELKRLYERWLPGESEEYEYLHIKRSSTSPEYIIIAMTTASDQGGIVAVVDMASGEIIHYHDGEYAISAEIYKDYVITIRSVHHWGIKPYNCADAVKLGTKENISGKWQIRIDESIGDDFIYKINDDTIQLKDSFGHISVIKIANLIGA